MTIKFNAVGRAPTLGNFQQRLRSPLSRQIAVLVLVAGAFLFGGGSRGDIASLIILRPLSIMLLGYGLACSQVDQLRELGAPLKLLVALAVLVAAQLIPLPPMVWHALPGRELIASIDRDVLGLAPWRPISLSPSKTLNTFFVLALPLAAMVNFAILPTEVKDRIPALLVAAGVASCLLGLLQAVGTANSPFYIYRITNNGMVVGLFSNRNHNAIFLACLVPLALSLGLSAQGRRAALTRVVSFGAAALFVPMVFATGSRAGSALLLVSLVASAALWLAGLPNGRIKTFFRERSLLATAIALGLVATVVLTILLFSGSQAFARIFERSPAEELRWQIMPQLWHLISTYFPAGSGFGSFYLVYQIREPTALLMPAYLNQAHNDFIGFLIEGGIVAGVLMFLASGWMVLSGWLAFGSVRQNRASGSFTSQSAFSWLSLSILLLGGLFDYPLRTPSLMCTAALLAASIEVKLRVGARQTVPFR
ncbi:hypothetical protein GRI89_13570 [Altererythrobacter salegens]|uniref:O-antigen ligase-related domain-containing protein n=1 Tax=Croceibacterium salegens TaxID=1737568 RepID=A0A6I4SYV2_9SPHN|nr:O-antigen ligase family protein [Croceibacterium salegens]MXO60569.1 hypothetical protein [Croceibacterium salegens]